MQLLCAVVAVVAQATPPGILGVSLTCRPRRPAMSPNIVGTQQPPPVAAATAQPQRCDRHCRAACLAVKTLALFIVTFTFACVSEEVPPVYQLPFQVVCIYVYIGAS